MKTLDRGIYIYRISYFNPYPNPEIGDFTIHMLGNTMDECILDLCKSKKIQPNFIQDKSIICRLDMVSDVLLDKLISQNLEIYLKRSDILKKKYDEFIKQNPTKPSNVSKQVDDMTIFSVL